MKNSNVLTRLLISAIVILCTAPAAAIEVSTLKVTTLRCEYLVNPQGIDVPRPRLFWVLQSGERSQRQTAYRVLVSSTQELLNSDSGDIWDSGKVQSDQSAFIEYSGRPLRSGEKFWWKVRVWDIDDRASDWSATAFFTTGLLQPSDWQGRWIASDLELKDYQKQLRAMTDFGMEPESEIWKMDKICREITSGVVEAPAVYLRKEFQARGDIKRATAYVSGLGHFELFCNGQRVSDHQLDPAFTDYEKRVHYLTHDVTTMVVTGRNALGAVLGNGWYNLITPHALRYYAADYIAPPKLLLDLRIEYADGTSETIVSDESWMFTTEGPIRFNCVLAGETIDGRKEIPGWNAPGYDDSKWRQARPAPPPEGALRAQVLPPVRKVQTSLAVGVKREGEAWRFDIGFETVGWSQLKLRGRAGLEITIHHVGAGGHTFGRYQTGKYICRGEGSEVFEPRFCMNGYRYVDVTGLDYEPAAGDLEAQIVCTDMEPAGAFSCSDERLNRLQEILLRTLRNYYVHIPNDPTREKAGWTQDVESCFFETVYNVFAGPTYIKWQRDFLDTIHENGYMPPVAPSRFDGPTINGPWWGGAIIYAPWYIYQFYGDVGILAESYPAMQKQFDYLASQSKEEVLEWGLGDWMEVGSVRPVRTPVPQTSTAARYYFAGILRDTASLLRKPEDAARYSATADKIRIAYNRKFLNSGTGDYCTGSQTSQLISLVFGLAPEEKRELVFNRFIERIAADKNHLTTGFVGTPLLLTGLSEMGRADLAWTIATQTDHPSFIDAVLNRNQTVMKEDWQGGLVQMPALQGPIGTWFYHSIAGIRIDPKNPGFKNVILRPEPVGSLKWAKAHHHSIYGRISSDWKIEDGAFEWRIQIPPNVTADAYVPASFADKLTESGQALNNVIGISAAKSAGRSVHMKLESGSYSFRSELVK